MSDSQTARDEWIYRCEFSILFGVDGVSSSEDNCYTGNSLKRRRYQVYQAFHGP